MADIRVGSIAIAKRASGEWSVDEMGICYEVYEGWRTRQVQLHFREGRL